MGSYASDIETMLLLTATRLSEVVANKTTRLKHDIRSFV